MSEKPTKVVVVDHVPSHTDLDSPTGFDCVKHPGQPLVEVAVEGWMLWSREWKRLHRDGKLAALRCPVDGCQYGLMMERA